MSGRQPSDQSVERRGGTIILELPRNLPKRVGLLALAGFFVFAGINHFLNPDFYVAIMPPYVPAHLALVYLSGLFEVLGGLGVLPRATRAVAGWGLIALLFATYPANMHVALNPKQFTEMPVWALYARLPLQLVFIAWAYWATRPDQPAGPPPARTAA